MFGSIQYSFFGAGRIKVKKPNYVNRNLVNKYLCFIFLFSQMDHQCISKNTLMNEFPHDGNFSFEGFDNEDSFLVLGQPCTTNAMSTLNQNIVILPVSIPIIPFISINDFPSQQFSPPWQILFTVKVVRANIDLQTEKPVNTLKYNRVVTVPIYNEDEACLPHIVKYVQRRTEVDVALVQSCGLRYQYEKGITGKLSFVISSFAIHKFLFLQCDSLLNPSSCL